MNWLTRLLGLSPDLTDVQRAILSDYHAMAAPDGDAVLSAQRFVVVDVESTGLNVLSDRLIAIGAVVVTGGRVALGEAFEVVLRQAQPSNVDNILVHGIDGTTQTGGEPPADALLAFLRFVGKSPLVAYHAAFDRTLIDKTTQTHLGMIIGTPWIDLAYIAPALYPELAARCRALDDWTGRFGIDIPNRHNALSDAFATAQLLLVMLSRMQAHGDARLRDVSRLEKDQRWLSRQTV